MISTSTTIPIRYTPRWREAEAGAPVYLLRAGDIIERGQLEAELSGRHRAAPVYGFELKAAVRDGVLQLLDGDPEQARVLDLIEAEGADDAQLSEEETALLVSVRGILAEHWPPYADLLAQMARRQQMTPILALQRFCVGWENVPVEFSRGRDGLVDQSKLAALEPFEMMGAGNRAYNLLYGGGEVGNLPPPSASEDGPAISSTDEPSPTDGKSKARSGRKTRA